MDDPRIRFAHDSLALLSAAERLQRLAGDRACAASLPDALACIEQSLRALSGGCERAAHALIPPAGLDASICSRYARARADWPGAPAGAGPSYEQQAELLVSLGDAGAALRAAAERCARTRDLLLATMDAPVQARAERSRSAPMAA